MPIACFCARLTEHVVIVEQTPRPAASKLESHNRTKSEDVAKSVFPHSSPPNYDCGRPAHKQTMGTLWHSLSHCLFTQERFLIMFHLRNWLHHLNLPCGPCGTHTDADKGSKGEHGNDTKEWKGKRWHHTGILLRWCRLLLHQCRLLGIVLARSGRRCLARARRSWHWNRLRYRHHWCTRAAWRRCRSGSWGWWWYIRRGCDCGGNVGAACCRVAFASCTHSAVRVLGVPITASVACAGGWGRGGHRSDDDWCTRA